MIKYGLGEITLIYYPPEVRRGEYWGLGVFLLQYFPLVKMWKIFHYNCMNMGNKNKKTHQMQYSGHNTPLGHHIDHSPIGLGPYVSLGEYCNPNTTSSVCIISTLTLRPKRGENVISIKVLKYSG